MIQESQSSVKDEDFNIDFLEGDIFLSIGNNSESLKKKVLFLISSMECFLRIDIYQSAYPMVKLAEILGSVSFYKKAMKIASAGLQKISLISEGLEENGFHYEERKKLELLIQESRTIVDSKTRLPCPVSNCEEEVGVIRTRFYDLLESLKESWKESNADIKRSFMRVSTQEFRVYVKIRFGEEGEDALEQVLTHAKKNERWKFWLCRSCPKKFSTSEECSSHLVQEHGAEFKPSSRNDLAQRVSDIWAGKVSVGVWKPVDAEAAVQMIKTDAKVFKYQDGWCKEWPLAEDEERSRVLNGIRSLLVSFCDQKILSERIRDRMMHAVAKRLDDLDVSKQTLTDCRLLETPNSICFLKCDELSQIFDLLSGVKCKRHDGIDLVCSAVDSFCGGTRVREKIDFDLKFSYMLLDKRLLQGNLDGRSNDEGKISFTSDPSVHCAKARPGGDAFLSWLADNSSGGDERFQFPRNIKAHNLDIWKAALRAIQFTCRTLGTKYAKKMQLLGYGAALNDAKELCIRSNLQEGEQKSLLRRRCEESDAGNLFLCAVEDVLRGAKRPTFDLAKRSTTHDDSDKSVMNSIQLLESEVNKKVTQMDSKILVIEKSRIDLLKDLTRLCVFDYRWFIHPPLKEYVLGQMANRFIRHP
ncbi:uncharacterized protein LOC18019111 [Eutrema salsugineum]|uniref:uncharacterized protein LOC18019111 n=1 Tax=Eutrema salsugineum TaxID=72664 RepID=UPI000CED72C6|nr:uncharacterized protein LOC18019111 [Eutrema salsugineum]